MILNFAFLVLAFAPASIEFDSWFTGKTLRFDYYHSGEAKEEHISLDQIRLEGDWPGSRVNLVDDTNLGKYFFEVWDLESNRLLYSRGFASIYGEWETTGEAKKIWRSFHESARFPEPHKEVQLVLKKRQDDGSLREIYSGVVDPKSRFVNRSPLNPIGKVWTVHESGKPAKKVDFLILSEGYTASEKEKFHSDTKRLVEVMLNTEPYKTMKSDINVWALDIAAAQSGISNPRKGTWVNSPLGCSFNAFDVDRYVLSYENKAIREAAALAPYDALVILFNGRKYGGGGIFNLWSTVASDTAPAPYVFVHEIGHSFAGLADEYYTSEVAYQDYVTPGTEPWEPNITALKDPSKLKWKDLVEASTPLPTPWDQPGYDKLSVEHQKRRKELQESGKPEEEMEFLFEEVKRSTGPMLANDKYANRVGAFEGAGYEAKGLYRPATDCIMFTRNPDHFCAVCHRAIVRVIRLYNE